MKINKGVKEYLQEVWDVLADYQRHKYRLIDGYDEIRLFAYAYKLLDDVENYKKWHELETEYCKQMQDVDNTIRKNFKHDGTMVGWIVSEFANAVMRNTNITLERKISKNPNLHKEEEENNNKLIYIFKELLKDVDEETLDNNIEVIQLQDKIEYRVKGIALFEDDTIPTKIYKLYHGTILLNALNIIGMGKLLSTKSNDKSGFYNKNKIFFTESLDDSIEYALRNKSDDIHVIFQFDLSGIDLYERKHLIVKRKGRLFFANIDELDIKDRISKIYIYKDCQLRETSIEEIITLGNSKYDDDVDKKVMYYKKKIYETIKSIDNLDNILKNKVIDFSKSNNLTIKESAKILGLNKKLYYKLFENKIFNTLQEHIDYLKEIGVYDAKVAKENIKIDIVDRKILYHGTTIQGAKNIIKDNILRPSRNVGKEFISYNKIFFTDKINYAKMYGQIGSINEIHDYSDYFILFECDLSDYVVYSYKEINGEIYEYFIWGSIPADCIKHIYLCKKNAILKEISRDELLKLEV